MMGAFLGRFGKAVVSLPGGCKLGTRPIDQHLKGFQALGVDIEEAYGKITAETLDKEGLMYGNNIYLDVVSVGATINLMLAACKAAGQTIIENCAREPHVVDVANFLNSMGAKIRGAGTDIIKITGEAGTGKTLLLFDIAKYYSEKERVLIISCNKET